MYGHKPYIPSFMTINKKLLKAQQYLRTGYYLKAIEILDKHLKISPIDISGLMLRGEAFLRNEQFELALIDYAKVVELDDKNILALNNFSVALIRCDKQHEAKEIIQYIHELDPDNFGGFINLGKIFQALGEYQQAVDSSMRAIQIDPNSSLAYLNLGTAIGALGQDESAKQAFLMSNFLDPENVATKINIAQIEDKLHNYSEAKLMYENILTLKNITPLESDLVKYYLSYSYLFFGQIEKGWDFYDYGFSALLPFGANRSPRKFNQPKWNGDFTETKTILIWREQGLGDEILFSSCLKDVHDLDLNIILECDRRLVDIFQRTYPKFNVRRELFQDDFYSPHNDFELNIAIGSLPKYFRNNIWDFERQPTIWKPLPECVSVIRGKLQPYQNKTLIGICWRSSLLSVNRNLHYTVLRDWEALLCNPSYQFVNLLHGDCEAEILEVEQLFGINILRWNDIDLKNDLETVLALVTQLDFVVSIGSAVSVIAAAGGVKTLVLLQESWVQLGHPEKYHWFPNVIPFVSKATEHVGINLGKLGTYISENITNKNFN
jgi:tetratricopeptide (TPR) repeat protein